MRCMAEAREERHIPWKNSEAGRGAPMGRGGKERGGREAMLRVQRFSQRGTVHSWLTVYIK